MTHYQEYLQSDYDWTKLHTKQILNLRDQLRLAVCETNEELMEVSALTTKVYEVLNTREHVPNKVEAKKIRQDKAKAARNR